jgi:hypothetical protein
MRLAGMWHEWGRRETRIGYRCESQKERHHLENQEVVERILLRWHLEN